MHYQTAARFQSRQGLAAVALSTLCAAASICHGETIPYGDFAGDHVNFFGVTETHGQTGVAFFGVPSVAGDSLSTQNANFSLLGEDGDFLFLESRLTMEVRAHPGEMINSVTISESGSFAAIGADAVSSVVALAWVDAGGGLLSETFDRTHNGSGSGTWNGSMTFSFAPATSVLITLDNQLFVSSEIDGMASINKAPLSIDIGIVPAPGTLAILGLGTLGMRRRVR